MLGAWERRHQACSLPAKLTTPFCGAPAGNRNALKHGRYARELVKFRRALRELVEENAGALERA
jgi:hypothetical protein